MNVVCITGYISSDIRYGEKNGTAYAQFEVKSSEYIPSKKRMSADYIPVAAFGNLAETVYKQMKRDTKVEITGRIKGNHSVINGAHVKNANIIADEVRFAERKIVEENGVEREPGFMEVPDES